MTRARSAEQEQFAAALHDLLTDGATAGADRGPGGDGTLRAARRWAAGDRSAGLALWRKLAGTLRLDPDETVQRVRRIAEEIPDLSSALVRRLRADGLAHSLLDRLGATIGARAQASASVLV